MLKDTHNVASWTVPLAIPVSVARKWKKMMMIKTTMVPATLMHHSSQSNEVTINKVTIAANLTKRKRLEEQQSTTQGKEGEHAHNIWKEGLQL